MDIRQRIAHRIRELRETYGQSQSQVADSLGITRQTLSRMEKGEVAIDSVALFRLATLFDRPVSHFYEAREATSVRLALRADHPQLLNNRLRNHLLDQLAAISDLEVAAGLDIHRGLPPTEPLEKAGERELTIVQEELLRRNEVAWAWGRWRLSMTRSPFSKAWTFASFPLN